MHNQIKILESKSNVKNENYGKNNKGTDWKKKKRKVNSDEKQVLAAAGPGPMPEADGSSETSRAQDAKSGPRLTKKAGYAAWTPANQMAEEGWV